MSVKVPAVSSQRLQRINDFLANLSCAVPCCNEELKEDNHRDEEDLPNVAKAEENEDYRHENNFGNRVAEIDKGAKSRSNLSLLPRKRPIGTARMNPKKDPQECGRGLIPHGSRKEPYQALKYPGVARGRVWKKVAAEKQRKHIPEGINKDNSNKVGDERLSFLQSNSSRMLLSFVLNSKKDGFVR